MSVRALERKDFDAWLPLMRKNCLHTVDDDILNTTWQRLINPKEKVFGLGAFDDSGNLQGFLHYSLHRNTAFIEDACYMQDLYVDRDHRRQGIARRLIWELNDIGKKERWSWIYWFAENNNVAAQNLYKNLGIRMNFSLHMLQTQD